LEDTVKLYYYSTELGTFVKARWITARFVAGGILIATVIFFAVIKPNQSSDNSLWSRSTSNLNAENNFLRYQVNQISPRVKKMEIQINQLYERANNLHMLLDHRKVAGDTVSSFTNTTNVLKLQSSLIPAPKSRQP